MSSIKKETILDENLYSHNLGLVLTPTDPVDIPVIVNR